LSEDSRIRAKSRVKRENGMIVIRLNEGNPEHWAHFEGEIIMIFDKLYRPLRLEIEIKDTMDSEKVLNKLEVQKFSDTKYEDEVIEIILAKGEPEHWAHFEGEVVMVLDKSFIPLELEIEIKDTMDSEKVLMNADLI
jgi:methyl coenzyme M reductase gamma subunit